MNDITIVEGPSAVDPGPVHYHCTSLPASLFFNQTPKITPCRLTSFYEKNSLSLSLRWIRHSRTKWNNQRRRIVWSKVLFSCLLLLSGLFFFLLREEETKNARRNGQFAYRDVARHVAWRGRRNFRDVVRFVLSDLLKKLQLLSLNGELGKEVSFGNVSFLGFY